MSGSQFEYHEAIQAFHRWRLDPRTRHPGIGAHNCESPCDFIPYATVKEYLGASGKVEKLLNALFGSPGDHTISPQYIREHYLRPFAILLSIGQGHMIRHWAQYPSLQDHRLPYLGRPAEFPTSTPDFFESFKSQQWQFCPARMVYNMNSRLSAEEILPIIYKEEIGQGGSAVIYKIVIHDGYNDLVPQGTTALAARQQYHNTFVVKEYRTEAAEDYFEAERSAFSNLTWSGKPSPHIIGYYGSFIHGNTYSIILEYADQGNLEDFFRRMPAPTTGEEVILFWDRLFNVTHGLAQIHGTPEKDTKGHRVLLGWHQDLKPSNLLVFSGGGTSRYDYHFKIADLGLYHFKCPESADYEDSDIDAFGTRAYGAPETFRAAVAIESCPLLIRQHVDIWSIGCVFSEAAIWARDGWNKVQEYRRQRQEEARQILGHDGEHLFHDGSKVLEAVHEAHGTTIKRQRISDFVTVEVLRSLVEDMLQADGTRPHAKLVFEKSKRIIRNAEAKFDIRVAQDVSHHVQGLSSMTTPEEAPKMPPNLPPRRSCYDSYSQPQQFSGLHIRASSDPEVVQPLNRDYPYYAQMQGTSPFHQGYPYRNPTFNISQYTNGQVKGYSDPRLDSHHIHAAGLHDLPDPPSPATPNQPSSVPIQSLNILSRDQQHERSYEQNIHTLDDPSRTRYYNSNHTVTPRASPRSLQPLQVPSPSTRSISGVSPNESFPLTTSHPATSPRISASDGRNTRLESALSREGRKRSEVPEQPKLSISKGHEWKKAKKNGYQFPLDGEENLASLNQRDHIFVIDNTESMHKHRNDVKQVIDLLAYMLKKSDPNGLDLHFTHSIKKVNSCKTKRLVNAVCKERFAGVSDMRGRLTTILQEHRANFGKSITPTVPFYKKSLSPQPQRPLSFYIFTDAKWQPNDVGPLIQAVVDDMLYHNLPKEHVGIQFIRFGDDQDGKDELDRLDRGLGLKEMDIVDTTSWNGNVWKQLLGAINGWYDDDPK